MNIVRWVGASAVHQGKSHTISGIPCQDCAQVCFDGLPVVAAVADGLGSATRASEGARVAVKTIINLLKENFKHFITLNPEEIKNKIVDELRLKIQEKSKEENLDFKDYATTIMFVATDGLIFISGNLGDGVISYKKIEEKSKSLFSPIKGEFFNETIAITSKHAARSMQLKIGYLNNVEGFSLFTDGTAESMYQRQLNNIAPAIDIMLDWFNFNEIQKIEHALNENLNQLIALKTQDDCSIAFIKKVDISNVELKIENYNLLKDLLFIKSNNKSHIFSRLSSIKNYLNKEKIKKPHLNWIKNNIIIPNL
jgi:hypothetical protein